MFFGQFWKNLPAPPINYGVFKWSFWSTDNFFQILLIGPALSKAPILTKFLVKQTEYALVWPSPPPLASTHSLLRIIIGSPARLFYLDWRTPGNRKGTIKRIVLHFHDFFIQTNNKSYCLICYAEFSIDSKFHVFPLQNRENMGPQTCQFWQRKYLPEGKHCTARCCF